MTPDVSAALPDASTLAPALQDLPAVQVASDEGTLWMFDDDAMVTANVREHGNWEANLAIFLRSTLEPGMRFVDVGAYVGYFSALAARAVGSSGWVHAFEPDPESCVLLSENLRLHGARGHFSVHPVAAAADDRMIEFASKRCWSTWEVETSERRFEAQAIRLDPLFTDLRIDVLKIDTEGMDHEALLGLEETLEAGRIGTIVVEFFPNHPHQKSYEPADVLSLYSSLGLSIELLQADGSTRRVSAAEVLASSEAVVDLVLRRK